jgi:predicted Zn-dependent protease
MKKTVYIFIFFVASGFLIAGCGKKLAPAVSASKIKRGFDSATFDYVYVEAIKQKLMGNGGEALSYLEHCVKINPRSDAAYYQMAQIVAGNGDLNNGKKFLSKALEIQPSNVWYLTMLSSLYYQSKNIDSAIIYYEKAAQASPDKENLQITLGKLYTENKNYDKAVTVLDELDKKYGVNETSTLLAIRNLMASGRYREAEIKTMMLLEGNPEEVVFNGLLAEIYQGLGENGKALEVYKNLIQRNPDNSSVQLSLCDFLLNSKQYDDLFILLNNVSLNENVAREEKISLFARILESQDILSEQGKNLLMSVLVLEANYPSDDIIPMLRVDLLIKTGKIDEAGQRLEDIIKKQPENYYAWEKLLLVYLQERNFILLEKRGEEAAKLFNRSFVAKILYANGALENKNYKVALEELRKATIQACDNKEMNIHILTMKAEIF